jgi:hypothetical protein
VAPHRFAPRRIATFCPAGASQAEPSPPAINPACATGPFDTSTLPPEPRMTRIRSTTLAVALAALSIGACSRQQATDSASPTAAEMTTVADTAPASAPPAAAQKAGGAAADATVTGPGVSADAMGSATMTQDGGARRFIRSAQVDGQVQDVQRAITRIEDAAARFGGFTTRNDLSTATGRVERRPIGDGRLVELSTYVVTGELQVRVPSDRAQMFLRAIAPELEFLDRRHYEAVDAQFELLRRMLARSRADQAQAALGDVASSGGKPGERAQVIDARAQQQAARDEATIEQRTFEDRVEFATLDLTLRQPERVRRAERPDVDAILRHEGPGFASRLGDAIAQGWRGLLGFLIGLVALWPMWLVVALAWVATRVWRARRR